MHTCSCKGLTLQSNDIYVTGWSGLAVGVQEQKQRLIQLWQPALAVESVAELDLRKYLTISQVIECWAWV